MTSMRPMEIVGIHQDAESGAAAVLLGDSPQPERVLPIMIGPLEAQSIIAAAVGYEPPRPGTHDLMATLMNATALRLDEVVVTELRDGVFFAELFVESQSGMQRVSARPSDGIALAMRLGAQVMVSDAVLEEASVRVEHESSEPLSDQQIDEIVAEFSESLARAEPEDFGDADEPESDR
jgi:bifunctional DNase/RNase